MKTTSDHDLETLGDEHLVNLSLRGSRDAYEQLVTRYQSLVCALAYNACGDVGRSEDLAQDAFLSAWRQLSQLREPEKFKSWLCGIVRNLSQNYIRRQTRGIKVSEADLEAQPSTATASPADEAVTADEQAILWRSLEEIPELYREPLILFYRENQSVETVARSLDLSEDAVKQRLSRGRQMLKEQVAAFVERGLRTSRPKQAFTAGVIAALSVHGAKAASLGVASASAKALATLKPALAIGFAGAAVGSFWGFVGGLAGGLVGTAGGLLGIYIPTKIALRTAKSDRERQFIERFARRMYWIAFLFIGLCVSLNFLPLLFRDSGPLWIWSGAFSVVASLAFAVLCQLESRRYLRGLKEIQADQGESVDPSIQLHALLQNTRARRFTEPVNYRSKFTLLGLPLIHVAIGGMVDGRCQRGIARGWIAYGDTAYGVLFASGGLAVGGIAFGGRAFGGIAIGGLAAGLISSGGVGIGIVAFGGAALGLVAFGGFAVGGWAAAGLALGILACGGAALGWRGAVGGFAASRGFAVGGLARAPHANDEFARQMASETQFFNVVQTHLFPFMMNHIRSIVISSVLLALLLIGFLVLVAAWVVRKQQTPDKTAET